jgi:hypothetical protein
LKESVINKTKPKNPLSNFSSFFLKKLAHAVIVFWLLLRTTTLCGRVDRRRAPLPVEVREASVGAVFVVRRHEGLVRLGDLQKLNLEACSKHTVRKQFKSITQVMLELTHSQ